MTRSTDDRTATPEALKQQAWDWLRLLHSGRASAEDARGFREWVRTSPAHQAMSDEVRRRWDELRRPAGLLLQANPEVAADYQRTQRKPNRERRAFLGAAIGTAAAAGAAIAYPPLGLWPGPSEWGADYRTAAGEQRTLALGERVSVTLNTRTSARRQMAVGETVGLDLLNGEAAVDLAGSGRPFAVAAGRGRVVADAGQFEIRCLNDKVYVTCVAGTLRVEHPAAKRALRSRQQAVYDARSVSQATAIDPTDLSAWRQGMLVFKQTRLTDALDEINRYRSGRVVLVNAAARDKSVTGHFAIASLDLALTQLQHVFGLTARSLPGGVLLLS